MFSFKTTPYAHQLEAFERSRDMRAFALFMEMGTGKSKVVIDTATYLYDKGEVNAVLIFGNKGSYRNWVDTELPVHMPDGVPYMSTYWDASAPKDLRDSYPRLLKAYDGVLKIFVMNIEALAHKRSFDIAYEFARQHDTLLVVDESTTVKNPQAKRTKAAIKLASVCKYRRIMTGLPITNNPLDLYAQCEVLGPGLLGFRSYFAFRACYADMVQISAGQRAFKKVTGYKNLDNLTRSIQAWSYRVLKDDCLDLPPKVYQTHTVELTNEQQALYDKLREDSLVELGSALVTTPLVITKLLRLHQLVCGHLSDDTGQYHPIANNRMGALMDVLTETGGKSIIWATYRHDIWEIQAALAKEYGPESVVSYYGSTDTEDRSEAVRRFQDPKDSCRFFVSNQATGGFGVTLTQASTVIYYSNNYNLELRLQSEDRAHRIGQTRSVTYVDLVSPRTVDEKIIRALRAKRQIATSVLGDAWREWI